uniref:Uncharacterized protein n=1 Tax=Skeletonema marinoi TaxID=267567 RepID=A0A7S2PSN9_9STRA|mmetsp:Transcript_29085/g.49574  ORF Transcript_29085/g.49574 Transcript_29085/m.49574 type:complete len:398 (+) Transcript_29085:3-1196(+)
MQGAMTTALPPPSMDSSQTKRRRLNSDQMLHMFLSDVIIESPSEIAGKKMLALAPTTTFTATDDGVDSAMPRPPLVNNNASMTSDQEMAMNSSPMPQGDDQATKQQVDYDSDVNKKPKQVTTDAAPNDATQRGTSSQPIITPSTATISELTAEIRSQSQAMMQRDQKKEERATSPSNVTQDSSSETIQNKSTTTPNTATGLAKIASVMEASQTSQQNIHDWDKQFGLKRAHSKTMRESCRSRKKVLDFLKGEIKTRTASVLSALFTSVECPTQWEHSTSAEAAADSSTTNQWQGGDLDQRSPSPSPSQSSGASDDPDMGATEQVKDDKDDELERMFRRASLECVERNMGEGASLLQRERQTSSGSSSSSDKSVADTLIPMMPQSKDADRVEYHARCA